LLLKEQIEIEGVIEVLAELSSQYRMAIVSTSRRVAAFLERSPRRLRPQRHGFGIPNG